MIFLRRVFIGLVFSAGLFAETGPGTQDALSRPLSVWDAVTVSLANNPDVTTAAARIEAARARMEEARSEWYPVLSADFGYLRSNAPSVVFGKTVDQRALNFGNQNFNDPKDLDNFETGATLRYPLYSPGRRERTRAARHSLAAARASRTAIENEIIDATIKAYYTVLEADELVRTEEASVKTIESELKETWVRYRGGAALETDVLSLEVRLAEAQERLIRAKNGRNLALSALANAMGLPADAAVKLSGEEWKPRPLPKTFRQGLQEALKLRGELEHIRRLLRSAEQNERAARRAYLPRVDASARGYLDEDNLAYDADQGNWLVGLTLSLDLFDGHRRRSKVSQARATASRLSAAEKKLVLGIQLEVKQAYLRWEEARQRVKVTEAAQARAEKALALVKNQFEGGAATITRYLEAELDLTSARARATRAKYDEKKAMAEVGRAIGFCVQCAREAKAPRS